MQQIKRSMLVPYSAKKMYDLVMDVPSYPTFLPYCERTKLEQLSPSCQRGELCFSYAGLKYSIQTENTCEEPCSIEIKLLNGPFRSFKGCWVFQVLDETASKVTVDFVFEAKFPLNTLLRQSKVNKGLDKLIMIFVKRAMELYD